jgi:hypothetical protein|nr:MAG TPA: HK97 Family Phage Portal Protein [Caudoviricetes sp.]
MKVAQIKSAPQFESRDWRQYGIQTYGDTNDFPQTVSEIVQASKTGNACLSIYNDFVYGHGFKDPGIYKLRVNKEGEKLDKILRMVCKDFTLWHGFAIHVNYNMNFRVSSIHHIPFESLRLAKADDDGFIGRTAYHPDWGRRDKTRSRWSPSDIEWFHFFNPDPEVILNQVEEAGGWDNYRGQILYFSGDSEGGPSYPVPIFIAEMTDMRTEEALANVAGRNACSNFLSAGILVDIKDETQDQSQVNETQKELNKFQGDENTSQLWYIQCKSKEEVPQFIRFSGENYDKAFEVTQRVIPENIGQSFKQPPILRAVDVGANFGADLMTNAYKYYNSVTVRERQQLEEAFISIFEYWWAPLDNPDFTIQSLTYNAGESIADRIGKDNMTQALEIIRDQMLSTVQKRNMLKLIYGLYDEEIVKLMPDDTQL